MFSHCWQRFCAAAGLFSGKKNTGGRLFVFCQHGQINSPRGSGFASWAGWAIVEPSMLKVKDTLRATVHLGFDGLVFKAYHGPDAKTRFENEGRVLRHLEARGSTSVPRRLQAAAAQKKIDATTRGSRVERLDEKRVQELFAELEPFGVRHDDPDMRNVTYRFSDGRFCLIDFEFAAILPESKPT